MPQSGARRHAKAKRQGAPPLSEQVLKEIKQRVASAGQTAQVQNHVMLPADVAITSASFVDLTGLSFAVEAGVLYQFSARIMYMASSMSGGHGFAINGPAAPTGLSYLVTNVGTTASNIFIESATAYDATVGVSGTATTGRQLDFIEGLIIPSVAGTVTVRGRGEAAFTTTAKVGTSLKWWVDA